MVRRAALRWSIAVLMLATGCGGAASDSATAEAAASPASPDALTTVAPADAASMSIADVLRTDERFSTFRGIVERTQTPIASSWLEVWGWDAARMGDNRDGVTVFAPTNAAFEALDAEVLAVIQDPEVDNSLLYSLLGHHYIHRLYPSTSFEPGPQPTWRRSASGPVELTLDPLTWGGLAIDQADLRVANGYIHAIAGVVVPDEVAAAADG